MANSIKLRNVTAETIAVGGFDFDPDELIVLTPQEVEDVKQDEEIFELISTASLRVENDAAIFDSGIDGWNYILGDTMPRSPIEGNKLAVHSSYKPEIANGQTYAIWSGAGDDMNDAVDGNGNGPILCIETKVGDAITTVDVEFNPAYGRVWLHEAYLKFTGAGMGDSISSTILSYPVPLQQMVGLDLVVDADGWISYSTGGPGTGTHGFADADKITLIDRSFSKDGDWNYDATSGLTPVFTGDGNFKMSIHEQVVHRYVNRIPCFGDCATYFSMSSDETTELLKGYFVRVTLNNVSNTVWHASVLMEIYREMTYSP